MTPQTGMSFDPWDVTFTSPWMARMTRMAGNFPPFRLLSWVRSLGGALSAGAAGPSPLASVPWQEAQYARNISDPEVAGVKTAGVPLITTESAAKRTPGMSTSVENTNRWRSTGYLSTSTVRPSAGLIQYLFDFGTACQCAPSKPGSDDFRT